MFPAQAFPTTTPMNARCEPRTCVDTIGFSRGEKRDRRAITVVHDGCQECQGLKPTSQQPP